jgi:hypothetical protein
MGDVLLLRNRMKVISLGPQKALIASGPYGFSRSPLYLGGNVFIFFGAALSLGSPTALASPPSTFRWSIFSSGERNGSWRSSSARHGFATRIGCEDGSEAARRQSTHCGVARRRDPVESRIIRHCVNRNHPAGTAAARLLSPNINRFWTGPVRSAKLPCR